MDFRDFVKPEFLLLIPALYVLGKIIKDTEKIADRHIPAILGVVCILLCIIYIVGSSTFEDYRCIMMGIFTALVQGLLCAGAAVYGYEILKNEGLVKKKVDKPAENPEDGKS